MLARASQLPALARAGREVTPASASSPPRHLLAVLAADELADLPRRAPSPWTSPFSPIASPSPSSHHGRRRRSHLTGVAAPTVDLAPYYRVLQHRRRPLLRASRAPSARLPRSSVTDLAFAAHRQRSPPSSPLLQLISDLAVCSVATAVSMATFPSSPLSLSSSVATARSSPERAAARARRRRGSGHPTAAPP